MDITEVLAIPGAKIQIRIEEDTPQGKYNDCLYYTPEELASLSEQDVLAAKQARVDSWLSFVTEQSSKVPEPPKVEDLKEQADQIKGQWERMVAQLAEVGTKEDVQLVAGKLAEVSASTDAAVEATPVDGKPIEVDPKVIAEEPLVIGKP